MQGNCVMPVGLVGALAMALLSACSEEGAQEIACDVAGTEV
jgi:hypothetical protein